MKKNYFKLVLSSLFLASTLFVAVSCSDDDDCPNNGDGNGDGDGDKKEYVTPEDHIMVKQISEAMVKVKDYVPLNTVIAHRGTTYWAPESTESAYRWARNIGADYLEADLQISSDGVVLVMHDGNMQNKTDITVHPDFVGRENLPTSQFTYEELMKLDAAYPFMNKEDVIASGRNRSGFQREHQYISTLDDLINIAQGKRIKRDSDGKRVYTKNVDGTYTFEYENDPTDNGNRPGIYVELKQPANNPGIEAALEKSLNKHGWNIRNNPETDTRQFVDGKTNLGNTNAKVVLQTFVLSCLENLRDIFHGELPTAYLLSYTVVYDSEKAAVTPEKYAAAINDGVDRLAQFVGPCISGAPNNYPELLYPWQAHLIKRANMGIHPWTYDSVDQMVRSFEGKGFPTGTDINTYYPAPYADGMFTNRSDLTIEYYIEKGVRTGGPAYRDPNAVLDELGY
jgi:glycerophosphoryl diester phosphodiesterase